ncbi:hypothetical protein DAETH_38630 (plasmid) [Deinococcus aetherius]|uniref:Uncharacterized protein n=1 Tax=Deinococcus aetherius TaxID=200252 RepID=A0ABM8AJB7_9DEIO|nr:hypothetical protein [Deinococcus aetherius]BDP43894.1 hypothetical protein DAETH_38630 [Deinococcus aetherius]
MNKHPHTHGSTPASAPRPWARLLHRWPTVLGLVVAGLTAFDLKLDRDFVSVLSALIVLIAVVYPGAALLGRRQAAWWVLLTGLVVIAAILGLDLSVSPALVLFVAGLAALGWGLARDQWRAVRDLPLETVGMLAFSALAFTALSVEVSWAAYLVAGALVSHAVWDVVHLKWGRVVSASYAEFCWVLDLTLGAAILILMPR